MLKLQDKQLKFDGVGKGLVMMSLLENYRVMWSAQPFKQGLYQIFYKYGNKQEKEFLKSHKNSGMFYFEK